MIKHIIHILKTVLALTMLLTGGMLFAEEPAVAIKALSESRFVYEPFYLQIDVTSDKEAQRPLMQNGADYTIASVSNGYRSPHSKKSITSFRVEIVASAKGALTIAPVSVVVGGKTLQTVPLRLIVDEPRRAEECQLEVSFSSTNLYVDQAVELTVRWNSKKTFVQYQDLMLNLSVLQNDDFSVWPLDPGVPEDERIGVPVNGQRIIAHKITGDQNLSLEFKYMLVPEKAGLYDFNQIQLTGAMMKAKQNGNQYPSYFNNSFFAKPERENHFERVYQSAPIPSLSVAALPERGHTPFYCGIAGSMSATASISPLEVEVGQLIMYEVNLTNMSFGRQLAALPDAVLGNIGPSFKLTSEPLQESTTATGRKFVYALRPLQCDIDYLPGLSIQIFDVKRGAFRMVRTKPLKIKVMPDGKKTVYVPEQSGQSGLEEPLNGVKGNRKQSVVLMNGYEIINFLGQRAWLFWLLPLLLWLCIRARVKHIERCREDAQFDRASKALKRFKISVAEDEESALRDYIADRFGLCAAALTPKSCTDAMEAQGCAPNLVQKARACLEFLDSSRYAPACQPSAKRIAVRKVVKAIHHGTKIMLLVLAMMPLITRADSTEQKFNAALQLRAERPDQAQPIFVEAALAFEATGNHYNAGNSWFFAGQSGRALAAYLAAQSQAPFNREINSALNFIRSQRQQDFPVSSGMISTLSTGWQQICCWNIHLRLGLLTLLYLGLWIIYVFGRISGSQPGRRFWIASAVLALFITVTLFYSLFQPARGVVIQSAEPRLGPGYAYSPAYESVLHPAAEFEWLRKEGSWVLAKLPDENNVWIHDSACVRVR